MLEHKTHTIREKKVKQSIKILQSFASAADDTIELCYSGGKDSDVIMALAQMAGIPFRAIYKNTTIDEPGTIAHVIEKGVEIRRPKETFFELMQKKGYPTMRVRWCCSELKEYMIENFAIWGIRATESIKRAARYKEPIICREYTKKKKTQIVLPILYWTNEDVQRFIEKYNIQCHPLYYVNGIFDVTKRLGCLACPLSIRCQKEDFQKYPNLLRQWLKNGGIWWQHLKEAAGSKKRFDNHYDLLVHNLFFKSYDVFESVFYGLFPLNGKEFLEEYFHTDL